MLTKLRNSFLAGIAVILPLIVTVFFLRVLINLFNATLFEPAMKVFNMYFEIPYSEYIANGIVVIAVLGLIVMIGVATRIFLLNKIFSVGEKIVYRLPLVNKIYLATKEISNAFLGQRRGIFLRVVLVEYPRKGIYAIGFITSESIGEIQQKTNEEVVNVFVPTTPNPTSGFLLLVPKKETIALGMSVEEGMKLVVSGGAVSPPNRVN